MEKEVPNVNLFLSYADNLRGKDTQSKFVKDHFDERRFYSCSKDYNYVSYVNNGSKEKLDYVSYSGNNEKSTGVFSKNGLLSDEMIKELKTSLKNTESVIWHGVISFTEDFGNSYCDTYEKALNLMNKEFPKFLKNAKLDPDNICWFAGLHENTDNKHIHFSFYEKAPLRLKRNSDKRHYSDGLLPQNAINKFKEAMELRLLNNFSDVIEKRKTLTLEMKKQIELGVFMKKIHSLIFILPTSGRMSYDSENIKQYKPQINDVVSAIITSNKEINKKFISFENLLSKRDLEIKNIYTRMKVDYSDKLVRDKIISDIYRRLGNIVLFSVKEIRKEQQKLEYETKKRLVLKHIEKAKKKVLLNKCFQLNELVNREIVSAFQEYMNKLEIAEYTRLKEEGYLD